MEYAQAQPYGRLIGEERPEQQPAAQKPQSAQQHRPARGEHQAFPQASPHPLGLARAQVLAREGHHRLAQRHDGIVHDQLHLEVGGEGGDGGFPQAVDVILGHHVGQRDHQRLHPRWHAHLHGLIKHLPVEAHPAEPQRVGALEPGEPPHHISGGEGLGDQRRPGRSGHAQAQPCDEQPVRRHVHQSAHRLGCQRAPAVAQGPQQAGAQVVEHDGRHGDEVDAQIGRSHAQYRLRRAHQAQIGRGDELAQYEQQHAARAAQRHRAVDGGIQLPVVVAAPGPGRQHPRAHRHAAEEAHQAGDQHAAHADGRGGVGVDQVAREDQIHRVVELLHQAGQQQRQREQGKLPPDAARRQIAIVRL